MRMGGPVGIGGGGLGTILIVLVISWLTGVNPLTLLQMTDGGQAPVEEAQPGAVPTDAESQFIRKTLGNIEDTWGAIFSKAGEQYRPPTLVLFSDAVQSACGSASAATGPFYCPADSKVYLDLSFFRELDQRFGAPGDFAQAYVLAHEVGHHLQMLLGIERQVRAAQQSRPDQANALSVRMELQADCLAGVWGHAASRPGGRVELEAGDVEEGLQAAAAIGDDRLQRMSTGSVAPERFTHGSSEQRVQWFSRGLESGNPDTCDTFGSATQ